MQRRKKKASVLYVFHSRRRQTACMRGHCSCTSIKRPREHIMRVPPRGICNRERSIPVYVGLWRLKSALRDKKPASPFSLTTAVRRNVSVASHVANASLEIKTLARRSVDRGWSFALKGLDKTAASLAPMNHPASPVELEQLPQQSNPPAPRSVLWNDRTVAS